ncbi:MAG: YggS family pyridoxal phosphate-dependent enzyme [Gammaproteobacteria bacterium]|nr:YggS family pyridoxal phosphate-dependent enzyme [Gammaproteobacteria bacterium]
MTDIAKNIAKLRLQIAEYAKQYHRDLSSIHLLAVSKTQPASRIIEAYRAGQTHFGENYLQEALSKMAELKKWTPDQVADDNIVDDSILNWHFIGPIQSNKTAAIAENFNWVHSVDRLKIAERLSAQRPPELPPLNIFLQLNLDNELSKSGFAYYELAQAITYIKDLPNINLRGFMLIPAPRDTLIAQRAIFATLKNLQNDFSANHLTFDQTSMGMSADMEAAIAEGSNWLRIGTAIFGKRNSKE